MSFEEKRVWIYAAIALGVSVIYFATVLGQIPGTHVGQIAYVRPLLVAVGVAIAANIAANIVAAIASPKEADRKDERDTGIYRRGQHVESVVLAVGMAAALGLAMAEFAHFWIANTIYLVFVLGALTSSAVKIVAYRRGF